jgi:hypothetical protein
MDCPRCRLISPDSAERCDCGYDFKTKTLKESYVARDPVASKALNLNPTRRRVSTVLVVFALARVGVKLYDYNQRDKAGVSALGSADREALSGELRRKAYGSYSVTMTTTSGAKRNDTKAFVDTFHQECFDKACDDPGAGGIPVMISKEYMACMDTALRTRP